MFTPQRKGWSATASFTPQRSGVGASSNLINSGKGKAVAFADDPPPPLGSLSENQEKMVVGFDSMGNIEDWKKFKEAGLLDEAVMRKKDHEALMEKVSRLEKELYDYQYSMGLLLIEKKEWSSKFDELRQELVETQEIFKREQSSHLIALSEAGKREENLRKALNTEKQCVTDLERALRAMREEHDQVQCSSKAKLAEASALVDGIEGKSSVVDRKLHDAEAKLAEVNRKSAELEMKLREVETRENLLSKEHLSVVTDRESFEATFYKQREDLKEWERNLKQREEMLCKGRQHLSEREEKENEIDKKLKQKKRELELLERKIDSSNFSLKEKETEISKAVQDLETKEKEADSLKSMLEAKEKKLLAIEHQLSAREREGIQKLLGEQKDVLDLKLREFELEMEQKRKSLDEEFKDKVESLEQREAEVNHREKKLGKEELALGTKAERIKEQEKEFEAKWKSLKEKEKSMKIKGKELEMEKKQLLADVETTEKLKVEVEKIRAEISKQELQMIKEREDLKITQGEREEHSWLQSELKQEIQNTRLQREYILKETESLKQERERFEKEWEVLDGKRAEISREQSIIDAEKEKFRKLQHTEEERLEREKQAMQDHIKRELEKLELEKESFADTMRHDKLVLSEKTKNDHARMLQDFESRRRNLENEIQKKQEEMEQDLQKRESSFQEEMEKERENIDFLKDVTEKECEEVRFERQRLENIRKEIELNKQELESAHFEMHEDSEMLMNLSRKVKKEREHLMAERSRFLALVEKLRGCKGCGEIVRDLVVSDLQLPEFTERVVIHSPISSVLDSNPQKNLGYNNAASDMKNSGSRSVSWLRQCASKILNLSPSSKRDVIKSSGMDDSSPLSDLKVNTERAEGSASFLKVEGTRDILGELHPIDGIAHHSSDVQQLQSANFIRDVDEGCDPSLDHYSYADSLVEGGPEDSQQSVPKRRRGRPGRRPKAGVNRTLSVKAVVEEAKEFLGKASEELDNANTQSLKPDHAKGDSLEESAQTEKALGKTKRKRQHVQTSRATQSEQDAYSEGHSDSITAGGRRKKRQTVPPPEEITGERRYNLRRHKTAATVPSARASKEKKTVEQEATGGELRDGQSPEVVPGPSSVVADGNAQSKHKVEVLTVNHVECTDERVVRFEEPRDIVDDNGDEPKPGEVELSEEVNGTQDYEDEYGSTIQEAEIEYDDEEDEEEGEEEDEAEQEDHNPGEVSIGKKILKFFTT
ncbi:protein CROWDED NUCLEI 2 isoform X2 [Neltuma alba]|uniref:protein CROWDED NUCLEI 2 isoform X2 n=1 Tax=Neltuma alba TaxID=207710 RepID=UPI0010A46CD8|nr:protein CROWDED NUCLEI 2-like isoform X2 [Prosopis alba]